MTYLHLGGSKFVLSGRFHVVVGLCASNQSAVISLRSVVKACVDNDFGSSGFGSRRSKNAERRDSDTTIGQ